MPGLDLPHQNGRGNVESRSSLHGCYADPKLELKLFLDDVLDVGSHDGGHDGPVSRTDDPDLCRCRQKSRNPGNTYRLNRSIYGRLHFYVDRV